MPRDESALEQLGWTPFFARSFEGLDDPGVEPARVAVEHNHLYRVRTATSSDVGLLAVVAGRLRHAALGRTGLPGVGDWVAIQVDDDGPATIRAVLPRRTYFSRRAAGTVTTEQIVAANIDTVFIVTGLDGDFSPRRVERYLTATADSGAIPVVVLNKADLVADPSGPVEAVRRRFADVPVHVTSSAQGRGLDQLVRYLGVGRTVALLGSSGAGKSTIINRLLGSERQRTRPVRARDGRGRHTTIHRELFLRPAGGIIIDTPGMRELRLWQRHDTPTSGFDDVERVAAACRFRDCRHHVEPGCAVREAVEDGRLGADRVAHYARLRDERAELISRRDDHATAADRFTVRRRGLRPSRRIPNP